VAWQQRRGDGIAGLVKVSGQRTDLCIGGCESIDEENAVGAAAPMKGSFFQVRVMKHCLFPDGCRQGNYRVTVIVNKGRIAQNNWDGYPVPVALEEHLSILAAIL